MLKIFNTLSRQKEEFKPIHAGEVGMYVCGVTIYDLCHIGHGRTFVSFDVVARYLRYLGYNLKYVRNVTDVDDKIIKRALENGETCDQLTERMLAEMHKDFDSLNIARPDLEPRATHHIPEIIEIVEQLITRGHAYVASNGDVMFAVDTDPDYGLLSRQDLEQLQAGARVEVADVKRNPMDFVLWKMSKPGEPSWESPWGPGRPGWHIECSAMNCKQLGAHFDIHGGGSDLMFPHHENEIAQSSCAHDGPYVNYWMHSGMVMIDREKMSKSLGNVITPDPLIEEYGADVVRAYMMFMGPYEGDVAWSSETINGVKRFVSKYYAFILDAWDKKQDDSDEKAHRAVAKLINRVEQNILGLKFNTSISALMEFYNEFNKSVFCKEDIEKLVLVIAPSLPHMAEELWSLIGHGGSVFENAWPNVDEKLLQEETIEIPVQINGRVKGKLTIGTGDPENVIREKMLSDSALSTHFANAEIKKFIYVPKRIINVVI